MTFYLPTNRRLGRSETLRNAIQLALGAGMKVGITFGNGVLAIPPGYGFEWACGGKVALRTGDGALVIYTPRRRREERPARLWVNTASRWVD